MELITAPSNRMTSNMAEHKSRGTSGEDFGMNGKNTDQYNYPCTNHKKIGTMTYSDGTYKEFFHGTADNGYPFSFYTCHCKNFISVGDNYSGSTGYHLHLLMFDGHQTLEFMQDNRNTLGTTIAEIEEKANAYKPASTAPATDERTFTATRSGKSKDNGTFKFNEKYYNDFKDLILNTDATDVDGNVWAKDTTWTSISSLSGSTSTTPTTSSNITTYRPDGTKVIFSSKDWNDKTKFVDYGTHRINNVSVYDVNDKNTPWLAGTTFYEQKPV